MNPSDHLPSSSEKPETLRHRLQTAGSVMLYGAGSVGRDVLGLLRGQGIQVKGFLDAKDIASESIHGLPLRKPDAPAFAPVVRRETVVVIAIFNAFVDIPTLRGRLAGLGWTQTVTFIDLHAAFPAELGDRYWLTKREYYHTFAAELAATRELLVDAKSRDLFDRIMRFRVTGDYETLSAPESGPQYFAADLPAWRAPLRVIDCGACDGDTFRDIRRLPVTLEAYAAFEPDPANFAALSRELAREANPRPVFSALWPCGVWREVCQLRFSTGQGAASAFAQQGDSVTQCLALDEALPDFGPTLIKMDIEGAEYAALEGAARMIRAHRPGLAICVYHEPAHLWRIPRLIADWDLGYSFYLRSHCYSGFDLVLYALPT